MAKKLTPNQQAVKILTTAKKLLSKPGGWIKGMSQNYKGGFCALGAVQSAAAVRAGDYHYTSLARAYLEQSIKQPNTNLISYNDMRHRRKPDVLRLFDRAIARAKAAE